jgi:hypothetical protein
MRSQVPGCQARCTLLWGPLPEKSPQGSIVPKFPALTVVASQPRVLCPRPHE